MAHFHSGHFSTLGELYSSFDDQFVDSLGQVKNAFSDLGDDDWLVEQVV